MREKRRTDMKRACNLATKHARLHSIFWLLTHTFGVVAPVLDVPENPAPKIRSWLPPAREPPVIEAP